LDLHIFFDPKEKIDVTLYDNRHSYNACMEGTEDNFEKLFGQIKD
jgi:hypothetical protein